MCVNVCVVAGTMATDDMDRAKENVTAAIMDNNSESLQNLIKCYGPLICHGDLYGEDEALPIWLAVGLGHIDALDILLDHIDLNLPVSALSLRTPLPFLLHYAVQRDLVDMVRHLVLRHNFDVNLLDLNFHTPLVVACDNLHMIHCLVEDLHADINVLTNQGLSVIHHCIVSYRRHPHLTLSIMQYLLDPNRRPLITASTLNHRTPTGRTLLSGTLMLWYSFPHHPIGVQLVKCVARYPGVERPVERVQGIPGNTSHREMADWLARGCQASGCLLRGRRRCGNCCTARYCSVACQARDWKAVHRSACVKVDWSRYLHPQAMP
jgi:hypothetical protein